MKTKMLFGIGLSVCALALAAKDQVIMTVNGVDVPKSEFEYLYHKNRQQQQSPQPFEDYVNQFKVFKMKVAEARAQGLDTLESFRKEMEQYRHELAAPYITDSTFTNKLLDEAVQRGREEVEAKHIMFFKTRNSEQDALLKERADSVRKAILAGESFEELAAKYSGDRGSNTKGGNMGYITTLRFPYTFETAAYNLKDGEISEVVESPVGYHILKGGKHRPASGKVHASHILISSQGETGDEKARHLIDSLYRIVKADPAQFADIARRYSDDKGSGRQGGDLKWFGRGEMVQEFDSVSFALPNGAISEPFRTRFGYHIIYRHDSKGAPTKEELKPLFYQVVQSGQDPRSKMIRDNQIQKLSKTHKAKINDKMEAAIKASVARNGIDSVFYATWRGNNNSLITIGKKKFTVGDFVASIGGRMNQDPYTSSMIIDDLLANYYDGRLVDAEEERLLKITPAFSNLYKEYYEGTLLYELSTAEVWDKGAKDEEGLKAYFDDNRDKFTWTERRAKGYLVQATSDSIADLVKKRSLEISRDSLVNTIRKEFPKDVSIMKVLETKGSNAMIDNIVFGGPEAQTAAPRYTVYFMIDPRVITQPEELNDVKGLVTSEYQDKLQKDWEEKLMKKYKVVVNDKVLNSVERIDK